MLGCESIYNKQMLHGFVVEPADLSNRGIMCYECDDICEKNSETVEALHFVPTRLTGRATGIRQKRGCSMDGSCNKQQAPKSRGKQRRVIAIQDDRALLFSSQNDPPSTKA